MVRSKNPTRAKIQRLRDQCDTIWSKYIRTRDRECLMCGKTENLQAHHCIVTKGASNATRYNLNNGITLCYGCHIHGIHGEMNIDFYRIYTHKIDTLIPFTLQDEVIAKSKDIFKMNVENLQQTKIDLLNALQQLEVEIYRYETVNLG